MKQKKYILLISVICLLVITFISVEGPNRTERRICENFIKVLSDCETYRNPKEKPNLISDAFESYFSSSGYERFLADMLPYIYPKLYNQVAATERQLIRLQYKGRSKENKLSYYEYELKYMVKSELGDALMVDQIRIGFNHKKKIEEVYILNTSDIMHVLFIDVKVQ